MSAATKTPPPSPPTAKEAKMAIGAAAKAVQALKKAGTTEGGEWDAANATLAAAKEAYAALPKEVSPEAELKLLIRECATAVGKLKKSGASEGAEWDAANAALAAAKEKYAAAGFVKGAQRTKKPKKKGDGKQQGGGKGGGKGGSAAKKAKAAKQAAKSAPVSTEASDGTDLASLDSQVAPIPSLGTFYVTTAINYTNGPPHIGHAYEGVTADIIARYHRLFGRETFFLTGTDEHGLKIFQTAEKETLANPGSPVAPIDICDRYAGMFQALNARLDVSNDFYVRTTQPKHEALAQQMFQRSIDNDDVFLGDYEGWYCVREERYIPEADAALTEYKDEYGNPYELKKESTYMFRASKYHQQLIDHIAANPEFIQPAKQRDNVLALLAKGCPDISVSRSKFNWGVPLPNDPSHVMYVWFDALTNYLSGIDYLTEGSPLAKFWDGPCTHIIGKDIVRFHCITWPIILMSCGVPLPTTVFGHGFVNDEVGQKMSKSIGNVVDPNAVLDRNPADTLRYYIARACHYGDDMRFSEEAMHTMHNADLLKTYGNAVKRATSFAPKYTGGVVPTDAAEAYVEGGDGAPFDLDTLRASVESAMKVSVLLFTVTFYANLAHSLTRSP
jgi:methionyl-tRNA synthetase